MRFVILLSLMLTLSTAAMATPLMGNEGPHGTYEDVTADQFVRAFRQIFGQIEKDQPDWGQLIRSGCLENRAARLTVDSVGVLPTPFSFEFHRPRIIIRRSAWQQLSSREAQQKWALELVLSFCGIQAE